MEQQSGFTFSRLVMKSDQMLSFFNHFGLHLRLDPLVPLLPQQLMITKLSSRALLRL